MLLSLFLIDSVFLPDFYIATLFHKLFDNDVENFIPVAATKTTAHLIGNSNCCIFHVRKIEKCFPQRAVISMLFFSAKIFLSEDICYNVAPVSFAGTQLHVAKIIDAVKPARSLICRIHSGKSSCNLLSKSCAYNN